MVRAQPTILVKSDPVSGKLSREKLLHSVQSFLKSCHVILRKNERNGPFLERTDDELDPRPGAHREMRDVRRFRLLIEPMTLQESDCAFTAFDQRSISNNHSTSLKEKELRKGVAMPSNATLLFDASTSESITVTTSSSTSAF